MTSGKFFSLTLLISLLAVFTGASQPAALAADPLALVAIDRLSSATIQRFQSTGLPAYALLEGYILAGADSAGQSTLLRAGLTFQILDAELSSNYYLATRVPSMPKLDWSQYGRLLLDLGEQVLLQISSAQAERLSLAGAELRYINLSPIVLPDNRLTEGVFPEVVQADPNVRMVINQIEQDTLKQYDRELAGKEAVWVNGEWYTITSRHTYSGKSIRKAAHYIGQRMADQGLEVEYHIWNNDTNPNVIGQITGLTDPDDIFIIGAHLDDVSGTPGADDNASGSAATMLAAELLSQYQWDCTVRFAFWTGEEQGLYGSTIYAQRSYQHGENIIGYLNLDMIAYNTTGTSPGIDLVYHPDMSLTQQLAQKMSNVNDTYNLDLVPQLVASYSRFSDHNSFWDYGFTSIHAIEDQNDFNPYYHSSGDSPSHIDLAYFTNFTKASIATFMHMTDCASTGRLAGTVTSVTDGKPIANADIQIKYETGYAFTIQTDAAGYYNQPLLTGSYTISVSANTYFPQTVFGIAIIRNKITTQDFSLQTSTSSGRPRWSQLPLVSK